MEDLIIKFTSISVPTEFDGKYLCIVDVKEECGTWTRKYKIVENMFNGWWGMPDNEFIIGYSLLPKIEDHYGK